MSRHRSYRNLTRSALAMFVFLAMSHSAHADEDYRPWRRMTPVLAATLWTTAQLIPSPLLVIGTHGVGGGVRWQVTPFLYSFGVAARPTRFFVVAPVARHSGAIELYASPEWTGRAPAGDSGWLARAGTRLYLPVIGRGESLSLSLGGSYGYENRRHGGAAELGFYTLSSILGISLTIAPWLKDRETMTALTLHYF
jgi:hypothetical protein